MNEQELQEQVALPGQALPPRKRLKPLAQRVLHGLFLPLPTLDLCDRRKNCVFVLLRI